MFQVDQLFQTVGHPDHKKLSIIYSHAVKINPKSIEMGSLSYDISAA